MIALWEHDDPPSQLDRAVGIMYVGKALRAPNGLGQRRGSG